MVSNTYTINRVKEGMSLLDRQFGNKRIRTEIKINKNTSNIYNKWKEIMNKNLTYAEAKCKIYSDYKLDEY